MSTRRLRAVARTTPGTRLVGRTLVLLLIASLLAVTAPSVPGRAAGLPSVRSRPAASVSADALPTAQVDGVVWTLAIRGDTVYAGGSFTRARPAGAKPGTRQVRRSNLLSFSLSTGRLTSFAPKVDAQIKVLRLSPDGRRLYVGGSFTSVNGHRRNRLAAFDTRTHALVGGFAPNLNASVGALAVSGSAVYAGGNFTTAAGHTRGRLAAFRTSDGALTGWAPRANGQVRALTLNPARTRVVAGGNFSAVRTGSRTVKVKGLTSLTAATGRVLGFAANKKVVNAGDTAGITSLKTVGDTVYGTAFNSANTGSFEGVFAADADSGAIRWLADCHGDSYDTAVAHGVVYLASHWHSCKNIGGFADTDPQTFHRADAVTVARGGTVYKNTEGRTGNFAGQPAPSLVNWFPDVAAGSYTGQVQGSWATAATSRYVVQGGEFPTVNGRPQQGLVRFAVGAPAPHQQGPRLTSQAQRPVVRSTGGGRVDLRWPTSWDRDDQTLTYSLFRAGTSKPVYTTRRASTFWDRPWLSFTDRGRRTGATYTYRVRVSDPSGNTVSSATSSVTVGRQPLQETAYSRAVRADRPSSFWRFDDLPGSTFASDLTGRNPLQLRSGVRLGSNGALPGASDRAATLRGTHLGTGATTLARRAPQTFTVEAWFRTRSTKGGEIISFGDYQTRLSKNTDRTVYLGTDGRVSFGVQPSTRRVITSAKGYADGRWHHVAARLDRSGMALYVDGARVARSGAATHSGSTLIGFWRVGGDTLAGWPRKPSRSWFAGDLDEVAVWNGTAVPAARIAAHHRAGR